MQQELTPSLLCLRSESVLMQAWKKTESYIRGHSWYANTLKLDLTSLHLPEFIKQIQNRLYKPEKWQAKELEIIPAPKNQSWVLKGDKWKPATGNKTDEKLRPLAYVDLQDQVVATAIMLCLANRFESRLGDPRLNIANPVKRRRILAYGHRLFCDNDHSKNNLLRHRWGSTKLYRAYFHDYQTFLRRPDRVSHELADISKTHEIVFVKSDLSKFYDRVRPALLHQKLYALKKYSDENDFFALAKRVFNWSWTNLSWQHWAKNYETIHSIDGFREIALPQGLVASGFFANITLVNFDEVLRSKIGTIIDQDRAICLQDACYYVDDFRLVLTLPKTPRIEEEDIKNIIYHWLQNELDQCTDQLKVAEEKTETIVKDRDKRFFLLQSEKAQRIHKEMSGPIDIGEVPDQIGALWEFGHSQDQHKVLENMGSDRLLIGVPDMADGTVWRFVANRLRYLFRNIRPLLEDEKDEAGETVEDSTNEEDKPVETPTPFLTKEQLDQMGKRFAAELIEKWVVNPGNVRLLRVALDLYPSSEFLGQILNILRPSWKAGREQKSTRAVSLYCLAELFRAGATETGLLQSPDTERLPEGGSFVVQYHDALIHEGRQIVRSFLETKRPSLRFPWYLMQQVFLYLISRNRVPAEVIRMDNRQSNHLRCYKDFAHFILGRVSIDDSNLPAFVVEALSAFGFELNELHAIDPYVHPQFLENVYFISPSVAQTLWTHAHNKNEENVYRTAAGLGLTEGSVSSSLLADIVVRPDNPFRKESNLLALASFLLDLDKKYINKLTPWQIYCKETEKQYTVKSFLLSANDSHSGNSSDHSVAKLFKAPDWCENDEEHHRFTTGLILRYALKGTCDFLSNKSSRAGNIPYKYKKPTSHWEQQRYASYQGRSALGLDWLPISFFTENLLFELLRWPGTGTEIEVSTVSELRMQIKSYRKRIAQRKGKFESEVLEQAVPWPYKSKCQSPTRQLRIGVVQTVVPDAKDFGLIEGCVNDSVELERKIQVFRPKQRRHLATTLRGVKQMLRIRQTHMEPSRQNNRYIELLVFPELAIHPDDVKTMLIPFVRAYKCIVFCGLVYHPKEETGSDWINSGLWLIPEETAAYGLHVKRIEQGKAVLAPVEKHHLGDRVKPHRPAQWIIEYQWHKNESERPLLISASICYDATDIELQSHLRRQNDLYIVCALNKDIGTFDRMVESIHYSMYQGVLLVNNGSYGGSGFYMPYKKDYHRQVFNARGQSQVSITYVEVSPEKLIHRPKPTPVEIHNGEQVNWKEPPAGWCNPSNLYRVTQKDHK